MADKKNKKQEPSDMSPVVNSSEPVKDAREQEMDDAASSAEKMLEAGLQARAPRFKQIRKNEDMYFGITGQALKGRNNVPFDCFVMSGFVDTLMAGITEEVGIKLNRSREQDKMAADKMSALWDREMGPDRADLNGKMLDMKLLMSLAGRGFIKTFVTSAPQFGIDMSVCDHYDMVTEAKGGSDLDKHLYKFQMNIFRSKQDLLDGVKMGFYNGKMVRRMINRSLDPDYFKKNDTYLGEKADRWANFGLSTDINSYVGTRLYRLVEGVIFYNGKWKYIVFSPETHTAIRFEDLTDVFEHAKKYPGRGPWTSSATHPHPFFFWTKAPADDIRSVAYSMKKVVNLTLDNLEKRNWDMTAYNPKMFTDPSQLLYRQDGLVRAQLRPGENISNGIYKFQTPDTTNITINLTQWLDSFLGKKIGISDEAQGQATTDRVGIAVSNVEQTTRRLMLHNKHMRAQYVAIGTIFDYGVHEHLREPMAIKIIGIQGARWDEEITREDTDCDFTISVTSSAEEAQKNASTMQRRTEGFASIESNPLLLNKVNPEWILREKLKAMGYNDEQARVALDTQNNGDEESLAHAAKAIQACLEGVEYIALYRRATTAFVRKILDFADDKFPLLPDSEINKMTPAKRKKYFADMEKYDKLVAYAEAHVPIAMDNMANMAIAQSMASPMQDPNAPQAPGMGMPAMPAPAGNPMM